MSDPTPQNQTESREAYVLGRYPAADGRTMVDVECPFCTREVRGYAWSMSGSGKRCECGAIVGYGRARRAVTNA